MITEINSNKMTIEELIESLKNDLEKIFDEDNLKKMLNEFGETNVKFITSICDWEEPHLWYAFEFSAWIFNQKILGSGAVKVIKTEV